MKKLILITLALISTSTFFGQGLDLGIKAGVNFATITDAAEFDSRTGFVGGVFIGGKFNDKIGIQADLLYSQQGAEFELGEFNLDYVNVPIVLKYFVTDNLNIQLGPQFGVLVDDETTAVGSAVNAIGANDFDLSGILGVGLDIPFGLRVEGRYNFGLNDTSEGTRVSDNSNLDGKNSVITLSLGYSFL
jgi:hypothetical protein